MDSAERPSIEGCRASDAGSAIELAAANLPRSCGGQLRRTREDGTLKISRSCLYS